MLFRSVKEEILQSKKDSYDILFAGNTKYIEGASALLKAFTRLKENFPRLKLHIIGMQESDLGTLPEGVACYGYLDKGKEDERETYYRLFKESKVFINTTPRWAGFSATAEAMYFYLPVLISPYDEFTATFGETINFGYYCRENSPVVIEEAVIKIFNHDAYELLCVNAHNAVKEFTWNVYMDKLINKTEALNEPN